MDDAIISAIRKSGLSIYDSLQAHLDLFIDDEDLENILNKGLRGLVLNQPLRTRSKVVKSKVCEVLGYPVPLSFKKTQPRFPGQNFDTYVQKSNNLQIWNEEVAPARRYVLIRVDGNDKVAKVRVVTGPIIAAYDTTGMLTQKFQASARSQVVTGSKLISAKDTANVKTRIIIPRPHEWREFFPIKKLFAALVKLTGRTFADPGRDQERNRGGFLHDQVCKCLEGPTWADNGQFPDIKEQLLEVKLQTSPTIDLGLVSPDSTEFIADMPEFRHCDVRYAIFYASLTGANVRLSHVILSTGADFFSFFTKFGGLVINKKLQIPLPRDFFG